MLRGVCAGVLASLSALSAGADDDRTSDLVEDVPPVPVEGDPHFVEDPVLREIADRIVNGRVNLNLVGDSITHTDMSAAYVATFRPKGGIRGYAVTGRIFSTVFWSSYTNAWGTITEELRAMEDRLASIGLYWFTYSDPMSPWVALSAPTNIRRISPLGDLPDDLVLMELGSGNYYDLIWADDDALTEPGARLRYRFLWYDHPDAMPFTLQGISTVSEEEGGTTSRFQIEPQRPEELTMSWLELPEVLELGPGDRDFSRRTAVSLQVTEGHEETPGESLIVGGARVWDETRDTGIQWGWTCASGAQAYAFNQVPLDAWRKWIEFQQCDTYLIHLGVNDLLNSGVTGEVTAERIRTLVGRIEQAHFEARLNDPSIREARFLLITPHDCFNPNSGNYFSNEKWVALAEGLHEVASDRDDTAVIDLRAMVEESEGAWRDWRSLHTRDGVHVKGPYWHASGAINWECHPYEHGAMQFVGMIWDTLVKHAPGPPPERSFDFCALDFDWNCAVDGGDLNRLLSSWGPAEPDTAEDIDGDGMVDGTDLFLFLAEWENCP